jgi:hypothetical protein
VIEPEDLAQEVLYLASRRSCTPSWSDARADRFLREIKVADASHMRSITEVSSRSAGPPGSRAPVRANDWDRRLDPALWP